MKNKKKRYLKAQNFAILYIEDDERFASKMEILLKSSFEHIDIVYNGNSGLEFYENFKYVNNRFYDLVITDIMMPKMDGITLCKKLFFLNPSQEIIITSAYGDKKNLIELINLGVKRFIEKPFSANEIIAMIQSIIVQNSANLEKNTILLKENFIWNLQTKELVFNDKKINLSYNEMIILELLILYPNQIFSNFRIFDILENENPDKSFSQNVIKSIIKRLRKKLPYNIIKNIYAQGYKLSLENIDK